MGCFHACDMQIFSNVQGLKEKFLCSFPALRSLTLSSLPGSCDRTLLLILLCGQSAFNLDVGAGLPCPRPRTAAKRMSAQQQRLWDSHSNSMLLTRRPFCTFSSCLASSSVLAPSSRFFTSLCNDLHLSCWSDKVAVDHMGPCHTIRLI